MKCVSPLFEHKNALKSQKTRFLQICQEMVVVADVEIFEIIIYYYDINYQILNTFGRITLPSEYA